MIRRSTLVLLTFMATLGASAGTALSTAKRAAANEVPSPARLANLTIVTQASVAQASVAQAPGEREDPVAATTSGELDINSRGEAVKVLQLRLRAGEYYDGPVDGIYGLATERAVRAFQADAGVLETGTINDETWRKLQLATDNLIDNATAEAANAGEDAAIVQTSAQSIVETAPTDSELPSESEANATVTADSEDGGLGRVFGLSVGLMAVLASFGIGFFLANKDKDNLEADEWSTSESASQPESVLTSAETSLPSRERVIAPLSASPLATNNQNISGQTNAQTSAQVISQTSGPMVNGQMGGTSPLTQVDIVDGLIGDLRNPDPARRRKAIWELGQRGNSVAMKPLVDAMTDADSKEKSLVLAALSEIGIRSLRPMSKALAIALQDDNPEVRKNAIRDLTRVYDLVVQISQMLGHATEDEDPEVRQTASWALEQLSRIRKSQDIDANVRTFTGGSNPAPPIDLLSSEASLRRSSQQGI